MNETTIGLQFKNLKACKSDIKIGSLEHDVNVSHIKSLDILGPLQEDLLRQAGRQSESSFVRHYDFTTRRFWVCMI